MKTYRTLIRGKLRQESSLLVGGSTARAGGPDIQAARDGLGRLTIPGTSLAGCLVETAARVEPALFAERDKPHWLRRITGKERAGPAAVLRESLWHFRPTHRTADFVEPRQGVGIRQATGATAREASALYDIETLPPGETWDLFLEVDTLRGGANVEALALLALADWARGRCWLGAGAARGLGWMTLVDWEVLRLPATAEAIREWPDSHRTLDVAWADLKARHGTTDGNQAAKDAAAVLADRKGSHHFAEFHCTVGAGKRDDGYGWDALSVGGHPAGYITPLRENLRTPLGVPAKGFADAYQPDSPVVTSGPDAEKQRPFLPGSGLRGPLRHASSRLARGRGDVVPDPNTREGGKPTEKADDPVSGLFGLVGQSAKVIVSDARLGEKDAFSLACLQHHAEDEFAGGVYGSGKFDRTVVLEGTFSFRIVVEADTAEKLRDSLAALRPALRLAELGQVPVGGAKTRGAGGGPWAFTKVEFGPAGKSPTALPMTGRGIDRLLALVREKLGEGEA